MAETPQVGQVWECVSGRHCGARIEIVEDLHPSWPGILRVRSLTAKNQTTLREVYWPDVGRLYMRASTAGEG